MSQCALMEDGKLVLEEGEIIDCTDDEDNGEVIETEPIFDVDVEDSDGVLSKSMDIPELPPPPPIPPLPPSLIDRGIDLGLIGMRKKSTSANDMVASPSSLNSLESGTVEGESEEDMALAELDQLIETLVDEQIGGMRGNVGSELVEDKLCNSSGNQNNIEAESKNDIVSNSYSSNNKGISNNDSNNDNNCQSNGKRENSNESNCNNHDKNHSKDNHKDNINNNNWANVNSNCEGNKNEGNIINKNKGKINKIEDNIDNNDKTNSHYSEKDKHNCINSQCKSDFKSKNSHNHSNNNKYSNIEIVNVNSNKDSIRTSISKQKTRPRKKSSEVVEYGVGNLAKPPSPDFTIVDFWFTDDEDNSGGQQKDKIETQKTNKRNSDSNYKDERFKDGRMGEKIRKRYREDRERDRYRKESHDLSRYSHNDKRREYGSTSSSPNKSRRHTGSTAIQRSSDRKWRKKSLSPSYSAQDQLEVDMLHKQQEEMVRDNYSTIPMDIDDDDSGSGSSQRSAPLPLIETMEPRPPPPPGEDFKPVLDQTALTMTRSNVAWMPGFVEVLEIDVDTPTPSPKSVATQSALSPILVVEDEDEEKEEEEDVWALRAQALKSLACKRAVRAKAMNKNKKAFLDKESLPSPPILAALEKKSDNTAVEKCLLQTEGTPPTIESRKTDTNKADAVEPTTVANKTVKVVSKDSKDSYCFSPTSSSDGMKQNTTKVITEKSKPASPRTVMLNMKNRKKALYERRGPKPPAPIHAPVIIQLTKEDFESEDEPYDSDKVDMEEKDPLFKISPKRRKRYVQTETLVKDVQMNIARCRLRMKKNSSSIVRDQLLYKRIQNQMSKQRALYQQQKKNVKLLQEQLQVANKIKALTMRKHNKLHEELKNMKEQLKSKIEVRNATDERILRAKSIVSTNRLQGNGKGIVNNKLKEQLLQLLQSLKWSYQQLVSADKSDDTDGSANGVSENATSSYESESESEENNQKNQQQPQQEPEHQQQKQVRPQLQPQQGEQNPEKEQQQHKVDEHQQIKQGNLNNQDSPEKKPEVVEEQQQREPKENVINCPDLEPQSKQQLTQKPCEPHENGTELYQQLQQQHSQQQKPKQEKQEQQPPQEHTKDIWKNGKGKEYMSTENKKLGAPVYLNLTELQNSITPTEPSSFSDCAANNAYTLAELLQGLGNNSTVKEFEIVSPASTNPTFLPPSLPSSSSKYLSPLSCFKSYRINQKFSLVSKLSIGSPTVSNEIQANTIICQHDLLGRCNDESCGHTHIDKVATMSNETLIRDLLSYQVNEQVTGDGRDIGDQQRHLNLYTSQYLKRYSEVSYEHLKEFCQSKQQELSETVHLNPRKWFNEEKYPPGNAKEGDNSTVDFYSKHYGSHSFKNLMAGSKRCVENQEIRYFSKKYNSIELLKGRLGENPSDVKLWISLVHRILNSRSERSEKNSADAELSATNREYALSVLSQGLEENPTSQQLWIEYLKLYSLNYGSEELREVCYHAVMYAANYNVWWTCLTLENTLTGKLEICGEMVKFIQSGCEEMAPVKKSHCLTETILYATQLLVCCGQLEQGKEYLAQVLCTKIVSSVSADAGTDDKQFSAAERAIPHMVVGDKTLLWVCLISLHMFNNLPKHLFSVEEAAPTRLVYKQNFLLEWQSASLNGREVETRSLLRTAIESEEEVENMLSQRMLLYENFVAFELSLGNIEVAVNILRDMVTRFPLFVDGWRLFLLLHIQFFPPDDVIKVGEEALANCPSNPIITYFFSKFLLKQQKYDLAVEKIRKCFVACVNDPGDEGGMTLSEKYKRLVKDMCSQQPSSSDTSHLSVLSTKQSSDPSSQPSSKTSSQSLLDLSLSSLDQSSRTYHCLCYCLLTHHGNSPRSALDAYEYVISLNTSSPTTLKTLWFFCIEYKIWTISQSNIITHEDYESLLDLLTSCFTCVSGISVVDDNPTVCWRDYHFHNKLVDTVLSLLPRHHHENVLCKLRNLVPHNIPLAVRTCCFHLETTRNLEQARVIYTPLLKQFSRSLVLWNCGMEVERVRGGVDELRWLLKQATKTLPFQVSLWKQLATFEVLNAKSLSVARQQLKVIAEKCLQFGIDSSFIPNLASL